MWPTKKDLISLLVSYHRIHPLKTPALFEGNGYSLLAGRALPPRSCNKMIQARFKETSQWTYGARWDFSWGDEEVLAAEQKWKFTFAVHRLV